VTMTRARAWEKAGKFARPRRTGSLSVTMSVPPRRGRMPVSRAALSPLWESLGSPLRAAEAWAAAGEPARAAPLWGAVGDHGRAARLGCCRGHANAACEWDAAGDHERAARAWEAANQPSSAAQLWESQGHFGAFGPGAGKGRRLGTGSPQLGGPACWTGPRTRGIGPGHGDHARALRNAHRNVAPAANPGCGCLLPVWGSWRLVGIGLLLGCVSV
jgi:hypothetical protein